ncbi:hypothetical protein HEP_00032700 [Hepatocystis sp. ex Piliocolobus tephrosceles]|nr:hypothetical protein HEP_00032700 [Hepatocystis sp. ex Piliocolobus tephrosceles]
MTQNKKICIFLIIIILFIFNNSLVSTAHIGPLNINTDKVMKLDENKIHEKCKIINLINCIVTGTLSVFLLALSGCLIYDTVQQAKFYKKMDEVIEEVQAKYDAETQTNKSYPNISS